MSIYPDDLIKNSMHHFPHFAEAYFNFFSFALWSHDFDLVVEIKFPNLTVTRKRVLFENLILEVRHYQIIRIFSIVDGKTGQYPPGELLSNNKNILYC